MVDGEIAVQRGVAEIERAIDRFEAAVDSLGPEEREAAPVVEGAVVSAAVAIESQVKGIVTAAAVAPTAVVAGAPAAMRVRKGFRGSGCWHRLP